MTRRLRAEYPAAAFLVAASLIFVQVSFTRLVGFKLHYHFVFFAISLALLGLGAAGTFVSITRRRNTRARVIFWTAALALSTAPVYLWLANPWLVIGDSDKLKFMGPAATAYIVWVTLPIVWLNFCGGVALTALFSAFPRRMGVLYGADLAGAATGGLLCLAAMKFGSPPLAFLIAALPAGLACVAVSARIRRWLGVALTGIAVAALVGVMLAPGWDSRFATRGPESLDYRWNHIGRVDIVEDHPGRSYVIDGDASSPIVTSRSYTEIDPLIDPAYVLIPKPESVAIIGSGGGLQVAGARAQGPSRILAIDINQSITGWIKVDDGSKHEGLFDPPVELATGEGRHELRSRGERFDVVVMHAIDTWSATASGAYALSENFLYTKEAVKDFYACLRDGGVMSIRRWLFNPPRENLRLFITMLGALEELGVDDPAAHLVMIAPAKDFENIRGQAVWGTLLMLRDPLTGAQLQQLQADMTARDWSILHANGLKAENAFSAVAHSADREAFIAAYPYLVSEVTDADPYIFQFHNPFKTDTDMPWAGYNFASLYDASTILLPVVFGISFGLSLVLILLPLRLARRRPEAYGKLRFSQVVYFSCLGVGFMALEVPLVQILSLYLGHPVYGFTVALVTLLAAAGTGSLLADRTGLPARLFCQLCALVLLVCAFGVYGFIEIGIAWPAGVRFPLAVLLTALIGLPLGFPLAMGVKLVASQGSRAVAWAWGVNGATSVVGSVVVMMLMVFGNGRAAMLTGAVCYALAAFSLRWWANMNDPGKPGSSRAGQPT